MRLQNYNYPIIKRELKYYKNLDGIRGIAAFSVLIFHFFHNDLIIRGVDNIVTIRKITEILQHGVTLFFVLSGFVITRILLNTKEEKSYFSTFYKRRVLRIFPLYYLYLIVYYYVYPFLVSNGIKIKFDEQWPVYLYLQNMNWLTGLNASGPGHFWSLAVEEHFYLFWPFVILFTPKNKLKSLTILLVCLSLPIKYLFINSGIDINYNTFSRYDSILIGAIIAIIERDYNYLLPKFKLKKVLLVMFILFLIGIIIYIFQNNLFVIKSITKHLILSLFFGFFIYLLLVYEKSSLSGFLTSGIMQYLGRISYGLYVWHMLSISITSLFNLNMVLLNLLITSVITIILAHISFNYYEKLFLHFKYK